MSSLGSFFRSGASEVRVMYSLPASVQAHQGEELVFILPAAILLGTWLISAWPGKDRPSEDSSEPHEEDPETPPTERAEPADG